MHSGKRILMSLLAVLGMAGSSPASAVVIDFEALAQTSTGFTFPGNVYTEDGFSVTNINGFGFAVPGSGQVNWYTGSTAMFINGSNNTASLARVGGGSFDLISIDLSEIDVGRLGPTPVTFTGHLTGGGTVVQSITLNGVFGMETMVFSGFTNLSSVTWQQLFEYHQFDNIVVQAVGVSAPGTASLLLCALGLLGFFRLSRRAPTAPKRAVRFTRQRAVLLAATFGLGAIATGAQAFPVLMTAAANNVMEVRFTAPAQPGAHNAIQFSSSSVSSVGTITAQVSLYDEAGLLGTRVLSGFLGGRFTSPTSAFSGGSIATDIDFSRIADGVTSGLFVFGVLSSTPGAFYSFDTNNIFGQTFGNAGGFPSFYPVVTSVTVYTASSVDEPMPLAMLALGLACIGMRRLGRAS